jgi:hypothetical protein
LATSAMSTWETTSKENPLATSLLYRGGRPETMR